MRTHCLIWRDHSGGARTAGLGGNRQRQGPPSSGDGGVDGDAQLLSQGMPTGRTSPMMVT